MLTTAVASILTLIFRAPLEEAANPAVTPNPAKAPWYFLWLQELVTDTTFTIAGFTINGALVGGIIIPGLLVAAALAWPYLDKSTVRSVGVWFAKERRSAESDLSVDRAGDLDPDRDRHVSARALLEFLLAVGELA